MSVLVVGGAGYIGAHVVRLLRAEGAEVVVIDNLSTSQPERVGDTPLINLDISLPGATEGIAQVIRDYGVDSVIHFAAKKRVGESVEDPLYYYRQNLCSMVSLLGRCSRRACARSSSRRPLPCTGTRRSTSFVRIPDRADQPLRPHQAGRRWVLD